MKNHENPINTRPKLSREEYEALRRMKKQHLAHKARSLAIAIGVMLLILMGLLAATLPKLNVSIPLA